MTALVIAEAVALVVLSVLVVGLLRSYAEVLRRLHALDGGEPTQPGPSATQPLPPPEFRVTRGVQHPADRGHRWPPGHDILGAGLDGEVISIRVVNVPRETVLLFLSSGCSGCAGFWADLAQQRPTGSARLVVVARGPDSESVSALRQLNPPGVDLVLSDQAWADFDVPGSPYVIVVDGHTGLVRGEGSGTSLSQVSALIRQALGDNDDEAVRKPRSDRQRESDVDRELLSAGVGPLHPSLFVAGPPASLAVDPGQVSGPGQRR